MRLVYCIGLKDTARIAYSRAGEAVKPQINNVQTIKFLNQQENQFVYLITMTNRFITCLVFIILTACLSGHSSFAQYQHIKLMPPYEPSVHNAVSASNKAIIQKIGKENFEAWLDSIVVHSIPFNDGCDGSQLPCDPVPPMLSDYGRISITYYATIPGYGKYAGSNFAYHLSKNKKQLEDHSIFPDLTKDPFKSKFLTRDSIFSIAMKILNVTDTLDFSQKYPYYHAGNFSYSFQAAQGSLILSANNGEVLNYNYFGSSTHIPYPTGKENFKDSWLVTAKQFLLLDDTLRLSDSSSVPYGGHVYTWQLISEKAWLVLTADSGKVLYYVNYLGPVSDYKKPQGLR